MIYYILLIHCTPEPFRVSLNANPMVTLYHGLSKHHIVCNAIGGQATSFQWTYNMTTNLTRVTTFNGRRSVLILCDLLLENTGLYTCTANSTGGMTATASTFIHVGKYCMACNIGLQVIYHQEYII